MDFFWSQIALDIAVQNENGHPSNWNKKQIDIFLKNFRKALLIKCQCDNKFIRLFNLPTKDGNVNYGALTIPSYYTFRRIFITKKSNSASHYRNLFAIYFNYDSAHDYINNKKALTFEKLPAIPHFLRKEKPSAPYPGLKTFSFTDCDLFHGREVHIRSILRYLHHIDLININQEYKDLILLYGQSGVGKSSLIHAGIIPRIIEKWDLFYARRDQHIGLKNQFDSFITPKPILLLFDQIEYLEERTVSQLQKDLSNFINAIKNDAFQRSLKDVIILLAMPPRLLEYIPTLNILEEAVIFPKNEDGEKDEVYIQRIDQLLCESKKRLFLVRSLGLKHNLWRHLYPIMSSKYLFRYCYSKNKLTLSEIYEKNIKPRKKLIILDQVEEAITRPNTQDYPIETLSNDNLELKELASTIAFFLQKNTNCKIILSFRADYLAEIEDILEQKLLNQYKKWLLKPLDKQGVKDAIEGPLKTAYFELKYYDGFTNDIMHLLQEDSGSNIAPALQIILNRLWNEVKSNTRFITKEIFEKQVRKEKKIIRSFLLEQLEALEKDVNE
ncbi:MAG: ATP-binding protein [Chitinophagales bacterium]|nr:ATP-binding protein [Chitinophagales bacterium]